MTVRALTRVNPEQAPKDRCECRPATYSGKAAAPGWEKPPGVLVARRGIGEGTYGESAYAMREAHGGEGVADPRPSFGGGPKWESEGPVVPRKPGNAGGGKGPWFWVLRKERRRGDWR